VADITERAGANVPMDVRRCCLAVRHAGLVSEPFPSPTLPMSSRADVLRGYLDYFRSRLLTKVEALPEAELRQSRLPSGWTPLELVKHLTFVELRWLEWGFAGRDITNPWGDNRDERWYVAADETADELLRRSRAQGLVTSAIIEANDLGAIGRPGPRWDGADPPELERVLLHLVQEYARHLGHLDIVVELADGSVGE
jgi:hypothetical protein